MKRLLYFALLAIAVVAGILLINTFRFQKPVIFEGSTVEIPSNDSAAIHLSNAIQIKTISFGDTLAIDTTEFTKFRSFMETTYPLMHQQLEKMTFNQFSYVFKWKGKDTTAAPYVLMAHMDVVPVEAIAESKWTYPSFSGTIDKDTIWGRGAVDDKGSAIAIMEAVESSLRENIQPSRTIYLCFGHDEEISGKRGALPPGIHVLCPLISEAVEELGPINKKISTQRKKIKANEEKLILIAIPKTKNDQNG